MNRRSYRDSGTARLRRILILSETRRRTTFLGLLLSAALVWGGCGRSGPDDQAMTGTPQGRSTKAPPKIDPAVLASRDFGEAPVLAGRVQAGELPPVSDRLPKVPRVVVPVDEIGQYGGSIRRSLAADIEDEDASDAKGDRAEPGRKL